MRPIVFEGTVGWVHPAGGSRGVVIAGAHGFEDLCSRRFLTLMARRLAQAGLPVLQFDYPGCGDAIGDHTEPHRVAAWVSSIETAIGRLKAETGVTDVLVIGFRLGALLAPSAMGGRDDVAGLALLAPPISGKAYVREMAGLARMIDAALPPYDTEVEPFDGIETAGFRMSAETIADLRTLEWREFAGSLRQDILLVTTQPATSHSALAEGVAAAGGSVRIETFAGFARLMSNPTANDIPQSTLEMVVGWAVERRKPVGAASHEPVATAPVFLAEGGYNEWPLVLAPAPEICGVLCMPAQAKPKGQVALILNAGAIPHIGWARGAVDMARSLARDGIASLRVDLPGLGQSGTPDEKRLFLYDERGRDDMLRIVNWLEQYGFDQVSAIGTCAGAYQAFHAARFDRRISSLTMVNPLCFAWNSSYALDMELSKVRDNARGSLKPEDGAGEADVAEPHSHGTALRSPRLKALLSRLGGRALRFGLELSKSTTSNFWRRRGSGSQSVETWMKNLTARGTRVLVVSAENDRSLDEIARHFGPDGERLRRMQGITLVRLDAADHTLTPAHARSRLVEHVTHLLSPAADGR